MKFRVDISKYRQRSKRYRRMNEAHHYVLTRWSGRTVKRIIRNISGKILNTRSGHLRRNVSFKVNKLKSNVATTLGTGLAGTKAVKYARIHEKGGKITPKRVQWLTIPFEGVKGRARNFPNAFFIKSKKGNLLLVERKGKGIRPLFSLRKEVNMPARHWLSQSIKEMRPELNRDMRPAEILRILEQMRMS